MEAAQAGVNNRMEPQRIVGIAFVTLALLGGMFLGRVVAAVLTGVKWNDPQFLGVEELTASSVTGFAIAIGGVVVAYLNPKVKGNALDIASELKKVTWPSVAETRVSTVAVIIATVVSSLILFGFDFIASKVMTAWLPGALNWIARL